ncbi:MULTISPECIES: helix-turn-helix domain-containing protein [Chryseobacterium]|uniref:Transcriptional regulator with XRE-family HTH domain n=1 Tax=Chryseobacterium camelliae TaxID=1265445 RepID=A0ABU0TL01_9FLAO|nr:MULTISPECIES: helix-turn-helix transcriptional regulator [Chryseobacterium]MDT3408420.1 transcriptional regulator with XRE-family HTH domain [Pseudacidovorax intermedius]MDQ1097724.1 transcriptional regulator with XRE-family HTH domain [Chryseobacterium camelliae]MDQ1101656.1 transcriptional regulator with XRE-family HTH domain [Chryseobacterium sp. SORGH_AS_1048]MDR6085096.1 transcriptional regulator with XRE-family HTH domain [Chryseobacterium sp. SORGH_AS_0909]MDR6129451.1 transcriptiona
MTATAKKHIGRNIARIREMRGMKQETLAEILGVSQQKVSLLENAEELEDHKLEPIAKALEIPLEALKNFSDDAVFNIISNTFNEHSSNNNNYQCSINPIDKLIEVYEENKKLYERLLETEKEKSRVIEELVRKVIKD